MAAGDHLVVSRGVYDHHAVDLGDDTVAQYGGGELGRRDAEVEVVSRAAYACGATVLVVANPARFTPDEIVCRARSRIGERDYSLFQNNCEHFVNWCRTGEATSRQVDRVFERATSCATKVATRAIVNGVAKATARNGTRVLAKAVARAGTAWLLLADAAQIGTEVAMSKMGVNDGDSESIAQVVGLSASVSIGGAMVGPVGAAAGFTFWVVGELVGRRLPARFR